MARVNDVYRLLDEKYPYCIQEDYDNSGIMADRGNIGNIGAHQL